MAKRSKGTAGDARPTVAIIGGGLAGVATAVAAVECGLKAELFEARSQLGGRAGSFVDAQTGMLNDFSQHVAMGCCTNFLDLLQRAGVADILEPPAPRYLFFGRDGRPCRFAPVPWLPAPLHLLPALARLTYLTPRERWDIARSLSRLARQAQSEAKTFGEWLTDERQSPAAIARFWSPIVESALSEPVERASAAAVRQVFCDGFLAARAASQLILPRRPMGEAFDCIAAWLAARGAGVHTSSELHHIEGDAYRARSLRLADGRTRQFDYFVLTVPWWRAADLLDLSLRDAVPALRHARDLQAAPIVAVHLWYKQPWAAPRHAMLLERTSQWLFGGSPCGKQDERYACQVVISAAHRWVGESDSTIISNVCGELAEIWPQAAETNLAAARVLTHRQAVFSMQPGVERLRPPQETPVENLFLAGDWTTTGWPATMEGAVRSGRLAVEAILRRRGRPATLVTPDLPRAALSRWSL